MLYLAILLLIILLIIFFLRRPQFGKSSAGERRNKIQGSPNFRNGSFQNISHTPALSEGSSYTKMMGEYFFGKHKNLSPDVPVPVVRTDFTKIDLNEDLLIWFGHSSYYLQLSGKRFLVDPVFGRHASPIPYTVKPFRGTQFFSVDQIPPIDHLIITHDHYDHLDHFTIKNIREKIGHVVTGLGTGAHLEHWGVNGDRISEMDWFDEINLNERIRIIATPARHFSGRSFKRNNTLWTSFILNTPTYRLFLGGDSGYDDHFKLIGERYGPFDLAILENGQYNASWKYIHMMPEEVVKAALDLRAKELLPVHWSKFSLAMHPWDDSIRRVLEAASYENVPVLHPMIGEIIPLTASTRNFRRWWE